MIRSEKIMKLFTKKTIKEKLNHIRSRVWNDKMLQNYSYPDRMRLYSDIKDIILRKEGKNKLKNYIIFLKKDLSKGSGIPRRVLFGSQKKIERYDKKLIKKKR